MGFHGRFVGLLGLVSAALPLSIWLLVDGVSDGEVVRVALGIFVAVAGLLGLIALGRIAVVVERMRMRR